MPPPDYIDEIQAHFTAATNVTKLGEGTFGLTYSITEPSRTYVAKVLKPQYVNARTNREMQFLALVRSPYVVSFMGQGAIALGNGELKYVLTEHIAGQSLRQRLQQQGPLNPTDLRRLAQHIARGLKALRDHRLTHRDVKPENIMIGADGRFVLIDLGLAKQEGSPSVTIAGEFIGTALYASLEQLLDARYVDTRADLFSLGCTLFEALHGNFIFPYHAGTETTRAQFVGNLRTKPMPQFDAGALTPVIQSLLAVLAYRRINTPDALLQRLGEIG
jgi:serine/threonine protein kinase